MNELRPSSGPLTFGRLGAYAAPALPLAVVVFPSYAILPGFYAQHTAIPMATIGVILIVARAFDAIVDPLIGYLSDRTRSRWGSRKPWVLAGSAILAVAILQLYAPAPTVGAAYYLGWFLLFYFGYSLIEIAHKAWGTDLARSYVERSAIAMSLAFAFALGNFAFAAAPLVFPAGTGTYDAEILSYIAWATAIALPLCAGGALLFVPEGKTVETDKVRYIATLRDAIRNGPLLRFLSIFLFTGLGQGIFYGLIYLYVSFVMQLNALFAWVLPTDAAVTLVSVPVWYRLVTALQKHRAWALGMLISAAAILGIGFLPTEPAAFPVLIDLVALRAFGAGVITVAPNALLGDVVDYELMKRKVNRAANFHALVSLATKCTATIGGGVGLILVGLAGFDAKTPVTEDVAQTFQYVALLLPTVILLVAAGLAVGFPLDREIGRGQCRERVCQEG